MFSRVDQKIAPKRGSETPDVQLSTGRVIRHRRQENGSTLAFIVGAENEGMSPTEYAEYCAARGFGPFHKDVTP